MGTIKNRSDTRNYQLMLEYRVFPVWNAKCDKNSENVFKL